MIESPQIGAEYIYAAKGGFGAARIRVRVTGFRGLRVETVGVDDQRRRDVPRAFLEN